MILKKRGRPSNSVTGNRSNIVRVRLSDFEMNQMNEMMERDGLNASYLIRKALRVYYLNSQK